MKKFSILLISAGVFFLAFGGYQWFATEKAQKDSLAEAKALLEDDDGEELSLHSKTVSASSSDSSLEEAESFSPATGETVGVLHIPKLGEDLAIVEGTDEDDLARGVGHYKGTAHPRQGEQIVLSGHRDTVFRRMGELEIGDIFTIKLPHGEFSYEITKTQIVDADDRTIIRPQGKEVLTVTTCYPFDFIGDAPDRYILTALPVEEE
ncbi:class D sortase [Oceanobacillus bengalensis]|uniref:Class D sortase n=1 Tax=Oceanobacillus bengalensis TaxID=1435466 RepID=A0A494Z6L0_9BACI|nr:class D sortase [Oceanobacillus bengalensis]RKQ18199.1 class D sortase [Oceanobacillus bengalensis]